jgi:ubiquinone/menaquinone biosynthesis C-methylase UbiE
MKKLWDKLAKKNSKYYINSDYGKGITEEQFMESGRYDYLKYILEDPLIMDRFIMNETTLLEIGCGIGRMTEFMAKDFKKVIGVDISGEMIRLAKERFKRLNYEAELLETDGESIPIKDESVDLAFSYLVFQHMKSKEMVENNFKEVYRVLKPRGLFKVRLRTDKLKSLDIWWAGVWYSEEDIQKLYSKIHFDLLKFEYVGNYGIWLWLRK